MFDRAYYINLKQRPDRRVHIEQQLFAMGISADRFEGKRYTEKCLSIGNIWVETQWLGILGCFMAHLAVLEKAFADSAQSVLVLEDDICKGKDWDRKDEVLAALPDDWDLFWFYGGEGQDLIEKRHEAPWLTHAYAVNGKYLAEMIKILTNKDYHPLIYPYDGFVKGRCKGNIYASNLELIVQKIELGSDIAIDRQSRKEN